MGYGLRPASRNRPDGLCTNHVVKKSIFLPQHHRVPGFLQKVMELSRTSCGQRLSDVSFVPRNIYTQGQLYDFAHLSVLEFAVVYV